MFRNQGVPICRINTLFHISLMSRSMKRSHGRANFNIYPYANSNDPDQPAHLHSLARVLLFAYIFVLANSEGYSYSAFIKCAMHKKGPYALCGQRKPRSACAKAQADQGLRCPLTESMDTVVYVD